MPKWDKSFFDQYDKRDLDDKIGMRDPQFHGSIEEEPKFTVKKEVTHARAKTPERFKVVKEEDLAAIARMASDDVRLYVGLLSEDEIFSISPLNKGKTFQKIIGSELGILNHRSDRIKKINLLNQKLSISEEKEKQGVGFQFRALSNNIDKRTMSGGSLTRFKKLAIESFRINKFLSGFESNGKVAQSKNFTDYQLAVTRQTTRKDNSKLAGFIDDHFIICRAARKNKKLDFIGIPEIDKRVKRLNDYISVQRLKKIEREYKI